LNFSPCNSFRLDRTRRSQSSQIPAPPTPHCTRQLEPRVPEFLPASRVFRRIPRHLTPFLSLAGVSPLTVYKPEGACVHPANFATSQSSPTCLTNTLHFNFNPNFHRRYSAPCPARRLSLSHPPSLLTARESCSMLRSRLSEPLSPARNRSLCRRQPRSPSTQRRIAS
jgi:hypothetical protein